MLNGDRRQADKGFEALLRRAGWRHGVAPLRALVAGVLAAPRGDDQAWMTLVAPPGRLTRGLRQRLADLAAEVAAERARTPSPRSHAERLARLRAELRRRRLDGFVVPRTDEHQGEYVPGRAERLAWLTGFTGSAGAAVVLHGEAAVFVDGRYTLQVRAEVDGNLFAYRHLTEEPPSEWVARRLPPKARLGVDPWLHTASEVARLSAACARADARLVAVDGNPIDAVWPDQPPPPISPVVVHPQRFAGKPAGAKRRDVARALAEGKCDAAVLTAPDSIAWLLNLRGGDVPFTPLTLAFAVVHADAGVELYIDPRKLTAGVARHLGIAVRIAPPGDFGAGLDRLGKAKKRVRLDPAGQSAWVERRLRRAGVEIVPGPDPCQLPKARKNRVELDGIRAAHRRDGAALTRFLAWLAYEAPTGGLTEIEAARHLEALRKEDALFRGLSFPTISGAGPNGAVVHYRASAATNRRIESGQLYLVDSGAQYLDGTTDVTRTIAIGTPPDEARDRFTRVLKGHIALATACLPRGTSGSQIDTLARHALWQAGLDYDHGTGHGVGAYLGVHEGPQRIAKHPNAVALEPGMVVSNEPGYYKAGAYGIRIENLVAVVALPSPPGAERDLLGFETLTLAPIDRALIAPGLLEAGEVAWIDAYHARVRETLDPLVDAPTRRWLRQAARPLG